MIGRVSGELILVKPPQILVDVSGIGYEIDIPISDCAQLPSIGSKVIIYTHLVVREDAHLLFGFLTLEMRNGFRQLIKVSGIGPKIALALLSTLLIDELIMAIENGDINTLCRTPGIGKKMAERMLLELKGKFQIEREFTTNYSKDHSMSMSLLKHDVVNALVSLGFNDKEVNQVVKQLPSDINDLSLAIKHALKLLN